jgi:hypothetical protein
MMAKPHERAQARRLRKEEGLPMKVIAEKVGVSPGSVHLWTSDIEIEPEHAARNMKRSRTAFAQTWAEVHRERRRGFQEEGRKRARTDDPLHRSGCMLFWAEGSKSRNQLKMCNSDPHMLRFFRRFLTESMNVAARRMRIRLHVYLGNGLSLEQIENFWLGALDLPPSCLRKHSINPLPTSSSGKKKNKLPHGVCTLTVNDTRLVQHIYGAIQEYGGFEDRSWLDGPPRNPSPRQVNGTSAQQ